MSQNFRTVWGNVPPATKNLIIINVIMYIATLINENFMVGTFAMFYPTSPFFRWWQPLTHMFMHGGFWHIFFNMYALLMFGMVLERCLGTKKFLIFYFVAGFGAAIMHTGVEWIRASHWLGIAASSKGTAEAIAAATSYTKLLRTPGFGASGAIYGILLGYAVFFPDSRLTLLFPPVTLTAKLLVLIFAGIELLTGVFLTADGVAHFAHLGGMLFGGLLLWYWFRTGKVSRRWRY